MASHGNLYNFVVHPKVDRIQCSCSKLWKHPTILKN